MLGDGPYIMGECPTLADALFIGIARWADFHRAIELADYPRVRELRRRLEGTAAFTFARAMEETGAAPMSQFFRGHIALDALPAG